MKSFLRKQINLMAGLGFFVFLGYMFNITIFSPKDIGEQKAILIPVRLPTAEGLKVGAPVLVKGVKYGSLHSLYFFEMDDTGWPVDRGQTVRPSGQMVLAVLALVRPISVYENYTVSTRSQAVLAEKGVEIDPGSGLFYKRAAFLQLDIQDLMRLRREETLPRDRGFILSAKNFDDPLFLIASVIVENRKSLRRITRNTAEITEKVNHGQGTIAAIINKSQLYASVDNVLHETAILMEEGHGLAESLRESKSAINYLETFVGTAISLASKRGKGQGNKK